MTNRAFESWYADQYDEWFHDRKNLMRKAWQRLADRGVSASEIAESFTEVVRAIKDQYGD